MQGGGEITHQAIGPYRTISLPTSQRVLKNFGTFLRFFLHSNGNRNCQRKEVNPKMLK
jgi:hypothetical protein